MSKQKRDHLIVLEGARLAIRQKTPFMLSSAYALTPRAVKETTTSFLTPGLVMGYNPDFMSELSDEEGAFVMLHEVFHDRLRFFTILETLGEHMCDVVNDAQDMVINVMLRNMGYPVFSWALMPDKFGFPEGLTTQEYVDLLLQQQQKSKGGKGKGSPTSGSGSSGSGSGDPTKRQRQVGSGHCRAPSKDLQKELDEAIGRSESEVRAIERRTAHELKKHIEQKGRGNLPGWMEEWAKIILDEPVRINWRQIVERLVLDVAGRIMMGGDDFSMRHPSKRSHVRRLIRPGLIEHVVLPAFMLDTSGSMNQNMMMAGIRHSVAILRQLGIEEAWYLECDAAVALEPRLVNLSFFEGEITFHGRSGTDFRPAFAAIQKVVPKPDLAFYWTDGDGAAPDFPPPGIETIWGLVPGRYSNRKPARWGHLVIIDEDPTKQQFFEDAPVYGEDDDD